MTKKNNIGLLLILLFIVVLSSCRSSSKTLYNPKEVAYLSSQLNIPISNDDQNMALYVEASRWINVPYKYGGTDRRGLDCSALTGILYRTVYDKSLERSSSGIAAKNVKKISKKDLQTGDLVFFATSRNKKRISHVGVMLSNKHFIHASTSRGVIVSHLDEEYYRRTFVKAGRVKK